MITIERPVIKRCPFRDETDAGKLTITLPGYAPELHALDAQVDELAAKAISHEDFTAAVAASLPAGGEVTTRWHTGAWDVTCTEPTTGPVPE